MFVVSVGGTSACLPAECQIRFFERFCWVARSDLNFHHQMNVCSISFQCLFSAPTELQKKNKKIPTNSLEAEFMVKIFQIKMQKETLGWKASRCPWLHEPISGWNTVIDGHYYVGKTWHAVLCPWISLKADSSFASHSLPWVVQIINYHRLHQRFWSSPISGEEPAAQRTSIDWFTERGTAMMLLSVLKRTRGSGRAKI